MCHMIYVNHSRSFNQIIVHTLMQHVRYLIHTQVVACAAARENAQPISKNASYLDKQIRLGKNISAHTLLPQSLSGLDRSGPQPAQRAPATRALRLHARVRRPNAAHTHTHSADRARAMHAHHARVAHALHAHRRRARRTRVARAPRTHCAHRTRTVRAPYAHRTRAPYARRAPTVRTHRALYAHPTVHIR